MPSSITDSTQPHRQLDTLNPEQKQNVAAFHDLPLEMVSAVISAIPNRSARSKFAGTQRLNRKLVAEHVAINFQKSDKSGNGAVNVVAGTQSSEEKDLLAELCIYATPDLLNKDKIKEIEAKFDEFLTKAPSNEIDCSKSKQGNARVNFIADNFHVLPDNLKSRAAKYIKDEGKKVGFDLAHLGFELLKDNPKNLQRCENILQIAFANPTYETVTAGLLGGGAEGIAKYIPGLKKETANHLAETILALKPSSSEKLYVYTSSLEPLIWNITAFSPENRKRICNTFYELLSARTSSRFSSNPRPLKEKGNFRFSRMCEGIDKLPESEQKDWAFITKHKSKYTHW